MTHGQAVVTLANPGPVSKAGRPPADEVVGLWSRSRQVENDSEVAAWLALREIDPLLVADRDLVRALPVDGKLPRWARQGGVDWGQSRHRSIVPLFDVRGRLASLRARCVIPGVERKELAPSGHTAAGLVFADAGARQMLETGALHGELWIVEGVPDFLLTATSWSDLADVAVLGVIAGSWTVALAARVPDGSRVVIATHHDDAGHGYAARILGMLGGRVNLERWRPGAA